MRTTVRKEITDGSVEVGNDSSMDNPILSLDEDKFLSGPFLMSNSSIRSRDRDSVSWKHGFSRHLLSWCIGHAFLEVTSSRILRHQPQSHVPSRGKRSVIRESSKVPARMQSGLLQHPSAKLLLKYQQRVLFDRYPDSTCLPRVEPVILGM